MKKCNKVKNPCKICLGAVTEKNGLQCQGACQTWIHYDCLNYTPGKIKDIKAGIIRVTCPCPDCKTTLPKEYRTDEPYSCNNMKCPANMPPKCHNHQCPVNKGKGAEPVGGGCALNKCGNNCKQNSYPQLPDSQQPPPVSPCEPPYHPLGVSPSSSSDACLNFNACPSGCVSSHDVPGDFESRDRDSTLPSMNTLENMCNTVGQLTNQINSLMSKMKQAVHDKNGQKCTTKGPRSTCPKPCYCPNNPGKRK